MYIEEIPETLIPQNLMLILGTNPLPNFVVARILANDATKLHLVVTNEIHELGLPGRLLSLLKKDLPDKSQLLFVKGTDPGDIFDAVSQRVSQTPGTWGLDYTGGKKMMSVQAYRGMESALAGLKRVGGSIFSYLDAETQDLVIKAPGNLYRFATRRKVIVNIEEILELHDRTLVRNLKKNPYHPDFGLALIEYCQDVVSRECWLGWVQKNLKRENGNDLTKSQARGVKMPQDIPIIGGKTIAEIEFEWGSEEEKKDASEIAKWLHGQWLDDYVWSQTLKIKDKTYLHQIVSSLRPRGIIEFEVDVVAMQGYRLFAISATTEDEKGLAKLKLFEAMERARQMGGDEAQVALVTFSESPQKIENQVADLLRRENHSTELKCPVPVFGIKQLPDLSVYLEQWIMEV